MTALTFEQDPVDLAVKDLLETITNLTIFTDGVVTDADNNAKTIGAPLPYVVLGLSMPFSTTRLVGGVGGWVTQFMLRYVHAYGDGCKNVAEAMRDFLDGTQITAAGRDYRIRLADPSAALTIQEDQTWTRPGGGPLFSATDRFSVI